MVRKAPYREEDGADQLPGRGCEEAELVQVCHRRQEALDLLPHHRAPQ